MMKKYILTISLIINLVFVIYVIYRIVTRPHPVINHKLTYWLHRDEVFTKLPIDSGSIVFIGDSHTQQFELAELFHTTKIKNRGINYDTALGVIHRLNSITNLKPSKIFIEIGINDLNSGLTEKQVSININDLILKIKTQCPLSKIYLESVLPTKSLINKINNLNKLLVHVAVSDGITFIDLDPYFSDNGLKKQYDSGDGIHLSGNGYLKWRDVLVKYL
jgi:lysophospholipase L1-like esterase